MARKQSAEHFQEWVSLNSSMTLRAKEEAQFRSELPLLLFKLMAKALAASISVNVIEYRGAPAVRLCLPWHDCVEEVILNLESLQWEYESIDRRIDDIIKEVEARKEKYRLAQLVVDNMSATEREALRAYTNLI